MGLQPVIVRVDLELLDIEFPAGLDHHGQRVIEEACITAGVLRSELSHHIIVIQTRFNSFLDLRVLYLLVFVNDILDLTHNFAEAPLSKSSSNFQVFQLGSALRQVHLVHEVFKVNLFGALNVKRVECCLGQVSIRFVFGPGSNSLQLLTRNFREHFVNHRLNRISLGIPFDNCRNCVCVCTLHLHLSEEFR